jgi:hypothetical protein
MAEMECMLTVREEHEEAMVSSTSIVGHVMNAWGEQTNLNDLLDGNLDTGFYTEGGQFSLNLFFVDGEGQEMVLPSVDYLVMSSLFHGVLGPSCRIPGRIDLYANNGGYMFLEFNPATMLLAWLCK